LAQILCISDAYETGMGDYFIIGDYGFAWRFELPADLFGIFTINLLEFLACFWTLQMSARIKDNLRYLSITDSKNTMYWLGMNKHNPVAFPMHNEVAREVGKLFLEANSSGDRTHIKGELNVISDSLSRDTHLPRSFYLSQLQENKDT